jgi:hypothetical protein
VKPLETTPTAYEAVETLQRRSEMKIQAKLTVASIYVAAVIVTWIDSPILGVLMAIIGLAIVRCIADLLMPR